MRHALGHDESLARRKVDCAIVEVDQETARNNVKEFIQVFMRMPMIFAFDDPEPHHRIVHFAKRLVPPFVCARISELLHIDHLQRPVQNVQKSLVRIIFFPRFHSYQFSGEYRRSQNGGNQESRNERKAILMASWFPDSHFLLSCFPNSFYSSPSK